MANPPVCRIMDYGKFRYEEAQKAKEARRKSIHVTVKEVKFRPKIGKGDFDTKMRHLMEFLEDGHKVKVTLQFRGREMAHPELGRKILDDVIVAAGPAAKVENQARMEGRSMSLVLAPDKKAQDAIKKAQAEAERQTARGSTAEEAAPQHCRGTPSTKHSTATTRRNGRHRRRTRTQRIERRNRRRASRRGDRAGTPPDIRRRMMPKMKTSKTAAKRFKKTGTGKLRREQAMRQHLFEKKPSTRTRRLAADVDVHPSDVKKIKRLLAER